MNAISKRKPRWGSHIGQRGGARCDLHGPGRVRLLRKHRISIAPGGVQRPGHERECQHARPQWLRA